MNETNLIRPYGDTMDDGKVQLSFTLPVPKGPKGQEAAKLLAKQMGMTDPAVSHSAALSEGFSYYIVYGAVAYNVDYAAITTAGPVEETMDMDEVSQYIRDYIGRPITIIGASTGTDAHTVGIDAIMNMKGFAGHYGLERYDMIEAFNLGSQVTNEDFIAKAVELNADALLVGQTVTQKDVHITNLTHLVEMLEAEGLRHKFILICGGARITPELAKELGYDAGFGRESYADDVATFVVKEMVRRKGN